MTASSPTTRLGTGQLNDVTIATPIFIDGELVAFSGSVAHMSDIGGTLNMGSAREVYEEGFHIPPSKLIDGGQPNEQLLELFLSNVRAPDQVQGDLQAMLAANHVGAEGLLALMGDLGLDRVDELAATIHQLTENAMRRAIADVPDGCYEASVDIGDFEGDIHLRVAIEVSGTDITVDFTGSSPESAYGTNCPMCYTYAYTVYPLKCLLEPNLPNNEGCFKPITVTAPEGSIANAQRPRACEMRNRIGHMAHAAIFTALADVLPDRVMGHSGSAPVTVDVLSGTPRRRQPVRGEPLRQRRHRRPSARRRGDRRPSPATCPRPRSSSWNRPRPCCSRRRRSSRTRPVPDGTGRARSAHGHPQHRRPARHPLHVLLAHAPCGRRCAGRRARHAQPCAGKRRAAATAGGRHDLAPGDVVDIELPSGGGKFRAAERAREAILADLAEGILTPEGARRAYGWEG